MALAIGAHDQVVKGEGKFDDGVEAWKGAVAWPHFFDHDSAVAGAEDVDHAACENAFCKVIGYGGDDIELLGDSCVDALAVFEVTSRRRGCGHDGMLVKKFLSGVVGSAIGACPGA